MSGCDCTACRARDARRFARIIDHNYPNGAPMPAARRDYGRAAVLNMPPVPEWIGEPRELGEERA